MADTAAVRSSCCPFGSAAAFCGARCALGRRCWPPGQPSGLLRSHYVLINCQSAGALDTVMVQLHALLDRPEPLLCTGSNIGIHRESGIDLWLQQAGRHSSIGSARAWPVQQVGSHQAPTERILGAQADVCQAQDALGKAQVMMSQAQAVQASAQQDSAKLDAQRAHAAAGMPAPRHAQPFPD